MGRIIDHLGAAKAIPVGGGTTTFTQADVPGAGVVMYHFGTTGAANTLNAIDRIRVYMNSVPFYNISTGLYRSYIQRFTNGQFCYPLDTAIPPPPSTAGTPVRWGRFTIPFCFLDREKSEEADVCQFPVGALPTIEIVWNATAAAGNIHCSWTRTDIGALCYPKLYSSQMNIAASNTNGRYPFSEDGEVRGFGIETTGLNRVRYVINDRQVIHQLCQPATSATVTEDSMLLEQEALCGGRPYSLVAGTAASDNNVIDPFWIKLTTVDSAAPGTSFFELTTLAAWSGVSSEIGLYAVVPYKKSAAEAA